MAKAKPKNYVDNKTFYKHLVDYQGVAKEAEAAGEEKPQVTKEIGLAVYQIANRLATKPNFSGYPFKEEMISDGIENAIDAVLKFKPEKSENPFAYFTQIIYYAFLRRIDREKKMLLTKKKYYEHKYVNQELADYSLAGRDQVHTIETFLQNDYMDNLEKSYEEKKQAKEDAKNEKLQ